ncbi:MAG TPA: hypothetical protein VGS12_05725 [Caulobacteraceae bacterium]|nr:hypothetical protein [Caulobacteraceae bacterium]
MDRETLAWVRVEAARAGRSVSAWIAEQLAAARGVSREKAEASARIDGFLASFPGIPLSQSGKIEFDRDAVHEDERFRRLDHDPIHGRSGGGPEAGDLRGLAEDAPGPGPSEPEPTGSE